MEQPRKVIVGYDLGNKYSQISCFSYKTLEPVPITMEEDAKIPTVLSMERETGQWLIGRQAIEAERAQRGILIRDIITKVMSKEAVQIYGQSYTAQELLEKYMRKTLTLVKNIFPSERITMLVVTMPKTEPVLAKALRESLEQLGIGSDRCRIMDHGMAYLYYVLNQEQGIWRNDVGLFDFNEDGLDYYQITTNCRLKPMVAALKKREFHDRLNDRMLKEAAGDRAYILKSIADTVLYRQIISTIYFAGEQLQEEWAEEVIHGLCKGRRVFAGENLYTGGACYAAKEFSGDRRTEGFILLTEEMIGCSVAMRVYSDGVTREQIMAEPSEYWYEVDYRMEVLLNDGNEIELMIRNRMSGEVIRERRYLDNLPKRPLRNTRLGISLTFDTATRAKLQIEDLGFGEIYPATDRMWEYMIDIGEMRM